MTDENWRVKVVGVRAPRPVQRVTGRIPSGRFEATREVVSFDAVTAVDVDFSGITFDHIVTGGSLFERCDFSRVRVNSGFFDSSRASRFVGCNFDRFNPGRAFFGGSRFEDCTFTNLRVKGWRAAACEFVRCTFTGRVRELVLSGTPEAPWDQPDRMNPWRTTNEVRDNDFSGAELPFFEPRNGVDLTLNRLPTGPDYLYLDRWHERAWRTRHAVLAWSDEALRDRAQWWLDIETSQGRERQEQILVHKPDWEGTGPKATWPKLWAALVEVLPR
jgi:hypothetical protein